MNKTKYGGAGIYRISFGNDGKCYIGQSMNVHRRLQKHISDLKRGRHSVEIMQAAYNRGEAFRSEVIEEISPKKSKAYLFNREAEEIAKAGGNAVNKNLGLNFTLDFFSHRLELAEYQILQGLWNFRSSQASYDEDWRAMDGSETPEISPARRAYNFALAILNDWIEQEEQK